MIDLVRAVHRTIGVVAMVAASDLDRPTPCPGSSVGDLIVHLGSVAQRLEAAGRKHEPETSAERDDLADGWRDRFASHLHALADAWSAPDAWEGTTRMRGRDTPARLVGHIALDEVVLHGWDIAAAVRCPYEVDDTEVEALTRFVTKSTAPRDGSLFGPVVAVPDVASSFDRLLGLAGRDPAWRPVTTS